MQLRLDAADRLVELVEERRGPVLADEAARRLFALRSAPVALARSLLDDVVEADARLAWNGDAVGLAAPLGRDLLLERATYVVVDLETTGLRPGTAQICEIGAVRIRGLELAEEFQTLVDPGMLLGPGVAALTGLTNRQLHGSPPPSLAVRRFLTFAGDAVLVAHNARFDLGFLDRETARLTGSRLANPVVDTVTLARRLLAGRVPRASLAQLSYFFGASVQPCHRALPDAQATAEVLLALIGLAQERGAETVADLIALSATQRRRVWDKRQLAFGAPQRPGVYLFRDRNDEVLYVGCARDLRARLRSYFRSEKLRPAVEAAVGRDRADRVARARLRARGCADGASADPRAAAAGERAHRAAGPARLAAEARRRRRRVVVADRGRARSGRDAARRWQRARCWRRSWSGRRQRCRGCGGSWRPYRMRGASRTRRGCATGSRRSSTCAATSSGSRGCRRSSGVYSYRRSSRGTCARSSSPADASRPSGRSRRAAARTSRSRRGSPPRVARAELDVDELFLVARFLRRPPPELTIVPLEREAILRQLRK